MRLKHALGCVVGAATLFLAAGPASAIKVKNGNFEAGNLSGWKVNHSLGGTWQLNDQEMAHRLGPPNPSPIKGNFSAFSAQQDMSWQILSRKLELTKNHRHNLSFKLNYASNEPFVRRDDLSLATHNQQFRVDILRSGASVKSFKSDDILRTLVATKATTPETLNTKTFKTSLTKYAGKTVRLRFLVVVTDGPLIAQVDSVQVKSPKKN